MRQRIKDIRREELLQATLETIYQVGLQNITVAKLSATAGMSQGMVHHYFKNKAEIVEGAIRYVNAQLRDDVIGEVSQAATASEKLYRIIEVNFCEKWFNANVTRLWVGFCAQVPYNDTFYRIQQVIHRRMHSNLYSCLKHLLPEPQVLEVAEELSNLIDGLWLRHSVNPSGLPAQQAMRCVERYLEKQGIVHR